MKKKADLKAWLMLEFVFFLYSLTSVLSKYSSASDPLSVRFLLFYGLIVVVLGIYALLWQQVIKHFELTVAYANKAVCLLWALIWSLVLFHDRIKPNHVIGIAIVMAGIYVLNSGGKKDGDGPALKDDGSAPETEDGEVNA
ncbi:MAG: EamA family transporter [Lachnospiraceae bacterium]|nr:EamA family transporter [Lachnospiraceae bacterium]